MLKKTLNSTPIFNKLFAVSRFIKNLSEQLENENTADSHEIIEESFFRPQNIYEVMALFLLEIFHKISSLKKERMETWGVQHNMFFYEVFRARNNNIAFTLRKMIMSKITQLRKRPYNKLNARLLGMLLYITSIYGQDDDDEAVNLKNDLAEWVKENYYWLYENYPDIAQTVLREGITFDMSRKAIIITRYDFFDKKEEMSETIFPVDM